jgi:hypothetical protein
MLLWPKEWSSPWSTPPSGSPACPRQPGALFNARRLSAAYATRRATRPPSPPAALVMGRLHRWRLPAAPLEPLGKDLQQPVEGVGLWLLAQALAVDGREPEPPPRARELAPHLVAPLGADVAQDGGEQWQRLLRHADRHAPPRQDLLEGVVTVGDSEDGDAAVEGRDDVSPCVAVALARRHPAEVRPLHPFVGVHLGGGWVGHVRTWQCLRPGLGRGLRCLGCVPSSPSSASTARGAKREARARARARARVRVGARRIPCRGGRLLPAASRPPRQGIRP